MANGEDGDFVREGNISLILDSYDDIFSDFDPRNYDEKALSDDFLSECQRAARDKHGGTELRLLVPKRKRKLSDEVKIKKRLGSHFQRHYHEKRKELLGFRFEGVTWIIFGILIMVFAVFMKRFEAVNFFFELFFVIAEPAGWFMFWEGLGMLFIHYKQKLPMVEFYKKMSEADIIFSDY